MITLFDERDLVSFGSYMISEERRKSIENNPEITRKEDKDRILKVVTQFDFNNWLSAKLKSEQEEQDSIGEEDKIEDVDYTEDNEDKQKAKIIELNPRN
jgi:hypothetical protein